MRSLIITPALAATLAVGLLAAPFWAGQARAQNDQTADNSFCRNGTALANQSSVGCTGGWVAADGSPFGPQADPYDTPHTPYPGYVSGSSYAQTSGATTHYSTHVSSAPVQSWTPPAPYADGYGYQASGPVVVTRGTHTSIFEGGHGHGYDVYVPVYQQHGPYCRGHGATPAPACAPAPPPPPAPTPCPSHCGAPIEGCFSLDGYGRAHPVACPTGGYQVENHAVYSHATARAEASVNISNAAFFNGLSGGVGGTLPSFYGGGGTFIGGGGGSVLSRAPLIRFGHHHGGGHSCNMCGGGMHGGGGD